MTIALRATDGRYVSAEQGGGVDSRLGQVALRANREVRDSWETFTERDAGDGRVSLHTVNGNPITAEQGGGSTASTNRTAVDAWERWTKAGTAYQSADGHFLRVSNIKGDPVLDVRSLDPYSFTIEQIEPDIPPVERIHIEGRSFVTESRQPWIWKGATNFLLFQRFLESQDIVPLLYAGANVHRFTVVMKYIPNLIGLRDMRPESYAEFWDRFSQLYDILAARGSYGEATILSDIQMLGVDLAWQQRVVGQAAEIMRTKRNAFGELANEPPKNGVDPLRFSRPDGVLFSRGSGLVDSPPPRPGWDFFGWHGRRDWPKVTSSTEDMWYVSQGSDGYGGMVAVHDEPIGFAETDQPNKRSTNPLLARQLGASCRVLGAGGTFHSDAGVFSQPLGPVQQACAAAFFAGLA